MKFLLILFFSLPIFSYDTFFILDSEKPTHYKKRKSSTLNIALLNYGNELKKSDLERIGKVLKKRFSRATNHHLNLNIKVMAVIPYLHNISSYPDFKAEEITDPLRLQRLWYYYNMRVDHLMYEIRREAINQLGDKLKNVDALLAVTGAQFEGIGYNVGAIGITEQPIEIAWGLADKGKVKFSTDYELVDELIHELGHVLGLGHASTQCFQNEMSYDEIQLCCSKSINRNDVMSYCRKRDKVNINFQHKFEQCHLDRLIKEVKPNLLNGKKRKIPYIRCD